MHPSRRGFLVGAAALAGSSISLHAAETDRRLVIIFLRGAMDGLSVVVPYGDGALSSWRPGLMLPEPGRPNGLADLGGFWGLHPALRTMHALYAAGDVLPIHCVAGPNRSRSHFEAQDMMEIGAEQRMTSGWLNRIAGILPASPMCDVAIHVGANAPLILHGKAPVASWEPFHPRPRVSAGFYDTIAAMHADDAIMGREIRDGIRERRFIDQTLAGQAYDGLSPGFPRLARAAATLLASADGPRLAELDLDGWDTHGDQRARLIEPLRALDEGIAVLRAGLASVWSRTAILVLTEFGRTVRINGSRGTDHGTGTVAFLIGGAVAGGRVLADWPGLRRGQLFEDRDLQPTLDIRGVAKGLVGRHLGLTRDDLATVFPDSGGVPGVGGLLRA